MPNLYGSSKPSTLDEECTLCVLQKEEVCMAKMLLF